jgi:hypothetical protein
MSTVVLFSDPDINTLQKSFPYIRNFLFILTYSVISL